MEARQRTLFKEFFARLAVDIKLILLIAVPVFGCISTELHCTQTFDLLLVTRMYFPLRTNDNADVQRR